MKSSTQFRPFSTTPASSIREEHPRSDINSLNKSSYCSKKEEEAEEEDVVLSLYEEAGYAISDIYQASSLATCDKLAIFGTREGYIHVLSMEVHTYMLTIYIAYQKIV